PEAGTTKTSVLPSYWPVNAICVPSGEKIALVSKPTPVVNRVASPPSRGATHRSPANVNAMRVLLKAGFCSNSGFSCAKPARAMIIRHIEAGIIFFKMVSYRKSFGVPPLGGLGRNRLKAELQTEITDCAAGEFHLQRRWPAPLLK